MMTSADVLKWSSIVMAPIEKWMNGLMAPMEKRMNGVEPVIFQSGASELMVMLQLISPVLAFMALVVVHELGHVVAGKLAGFRVVSVQFGRLQITPPLHFKWNPRDPEAAGFVQHLPVYSQNLRIRQLAAYSGGPAANLASAVVALFLPHVPGFSAWFFGLSLLFGIANLVPFGPDRIVADGQHILMLLRNRHQKTDQVLAIMQLADDLFNGTEPENLRPDFLAIATAVKENSLGTVFGHDIAYTSAYYRHDDEEAARVLEICLQYSGCAPQLIRESLFGHAACFQAIRRKRVDLARQWLADIPEKPVRPEERPTIEAYILAGEGDIESALKKLDEAEVVHKPSEPRYQKLFLHFQQKMRQDLTSSVSAN